MNKKARILIADDEASLRLVLRETLAEAGHEVTCAANGAEAQAALAAQNFDVAFLDIRMPEPTGLQLLQQLHKEGADTAVVIITAQNTFENAVEAMQQGALDYLVKPFSTAALPPLVAKALHLRALQKEVQTLRAARAQNAPAETSAGQQLIGESPAILTVVKTIGRVARSDLPVLIHGESGCGKELAAHAIHAASARAAGPFVTVNAAAIPQELMESELFGHERGAFTGATFARSGRFRDAEGGTIFLDEIGDMPQALQAKLLRVLQNGEVIPVGGKRPQHADVRVIAATHRDLAQAAATGEFREDLLYRLRVVPLEIPPLRERREDIPRLAHYFLQRYGATLTGKKTAPELTQKALQKLRAHHWPGNVRELENAIKRALVLTGGNVLAPEDFAFLNSTVQQTAAAAGAADETQKPALEQAMQAAAEAALDAAQNNVHQTLLERAERALLQSALQRTGGNQLRAASLLGMNRNTLRKKIIALGLQPDPPQ